MLVLRVFSDQCQRLRQPFGWAGKLQQTLKLRDTLQKKVGKTQVRGASNRLPHAKKRSAKGRSASVQAHRVWRDQLDRR